MQYFWNKLGRIFYRQFYNIIASSYCRILIMFTKLSWINFIFLLQICKLSKYTQRHLLYIFPSTFSNFFCSATELNILYSSYCTHNMFLKLHVHYISHIVHIQYSSYCTHTFPHTVHTIFIILYILYSSYCTYYINHIVHNIFFILYTH